MSIKKCPLCGHGKSTFVFKKNFILRNFNAEVLQTYSICPKCFFVFTQDPLKKESLQKYYEANTQERRVDPNKKEIEYMEKQLDFVSGSLSIINMSVLEIGANNGSFLEQYIRRGASQVFYLELNKECLVILRNKKKFIDFNLVGEQKRKKSLDHIVLLHTLEHIVNPRVFIKKMSMYLKDEGSFFIEVPDFTFHDADTDELFFEHVNFFTEATLRGMFIDLGFTVISSQITLDRSYSACPKYVVRMIVRKSRKSSKTLSQCIRSFQNKEEEKKNVFKKIDGYLDLLPNDTKLAIYTASWLTLECFKKTKMLKNKVIAIYDRDTKKQGTKMEGVHIYDPKDILSMKINKVIILNEGYEREIYQYLQGLGFESHQIVKWSDFL